MRNIIIATAALAAIGAFALSAVGQSSPSPAATQAWVRDYVLTNAVISANTSNAIERVSADAARGMSAVMEILRTDTSTNAVQRAAEVYVNHIRPSVEFVIRESIGL